MNLSAWIRQFHRWMAALFTLVVIAIFAMLGLGLQPAEWVYFVPLPPLFLLMFSGLYMFVLPYAVARRAGEKA
jgi:hypothetical protein